MNYPMHELPLITHIVLPMNSPCIHRERGEGGKETDVEAEAAAANAAAVQAVRDEMEEKGRLYEEEKAHLCTVNEAMGTELSEMRLHLASLQVRH